MADLSLRGVSRSYGAFDALKDLSLDIADGEFVSLLGPSGCGKSTTLGLIAGLDRPTAGSIRIGERVMADGATGRFLPAEQRNLGLVLQSYALWPHMTVRQNVELPLKIRGMTRRERAARVEEYLGLVEMSDHAGRYPHELSGGQQQRVALARTLVYEPILLLLDEPLSNVDAKLRERARTWLKALQRRLKVTTVFVTHDQSEALAMSDRVALISQGALVQVGRPTEIYRNPGTPFVADFVGSSNLLSGISDGPERVLIGGSVPIAASGEVPRTRAVTVALRPEQIEVLRPGESAENELEIEITGADFQGARSLYFARLGEQSLRFESGELGLSGTVRVGFSHHAPVVYEALQ